MATSKRFFELMELMEDIHARKNAGYSGEDSADPWANFRMSELLGITPLEGCLVRMGDKYVRSCNLLRDPDNNQVSENITDTLIDLAVYSLIAICLYEEDLLIKEKKTISKTIDDKLENELPFVESNKFMKELDKKYDLKPSLIGKYVKVIQDGRYCGVGLVKAMSPNGALVKFDNGTMIEASLFSISLIE